MKRVQWLGHITAQANEFIGREREITVDISLNQLRLHDGATPGGHAIPSLAELETLFQPFGGSQFDDIEVDVITEHTGNAGVTIETVLIKDGLVDGVDISQLDLDVDAIVTSVTNIGNSLSSHIANVANPHAVTKTQVGLANVSNDAQLKIASNLIDLNNVVTARSNLGLGSLAVLSTIVSANITDGTIVGGDLANDTVPYAKIQNVSATNRLLGRFTAGAGDVEEATLGAGLSFVAGALTLASQGILIYQDRKANGTDGGTPVALTRTKRICDDLVVNTTGITHAASVFTVPVGKWLILWFTTFYNMTAGYASFIRNTTDGVDVAKGATGDNTGLPVQSPGMGYLDVTSGTKNVQIEYFTGNANPDGLGIQSAPTGEEEVYTTLVMLKIG